MPGWPWAYILSYNFLIYKPRILNYLIPIVLFSSKIYDKNIGFQYPSKNEKYFYNTK